MKKFSDILLKVFSVGVLLILFAGAMTLIGYIVAMFIGGEVATEICVFIHKTFFPYVIRVTSIVVGIGLFGMYLSKMKALSVSDTQEEN